MGNLKFFENLIETKLLNTHTAYIARVLSTNGVTAKIAPLGMTKAYGETALTQSPLSNVPVLHSARYKMAKQKIRYVSEVKVEKSEYVTSVTPEFKEVTVLVPTDISAGDIVLCVCCDRDITEARRGNNAVPPIGHHSMSSSVIVGIL